MSGPQDDPLPAAVGLDGVAGQVRWAVPFAARPGYRPLELDLYLPAAGDVAPPVVLFLHGGGWLAGSRQVFSPTWRHWRPDPFARLVAAGFAVAAVDYRLSAEVLFPGQLHDVRAAVRWLRARAGELGIDAARIVAWGESAGAHLAALLALTADGPHLPDDDGPHETSCAVSGVVDWYGPADLLSFAAQNGPDALTHPDAPDSREALLIGAPVPDAPDLARRASPTTYVHGAAPPFHIAHGSADRFVPAAQSRQLHEALLAAGVEAELTVVAGADHMWIGADDPQGVFDAAVRFARRVTSG